MAIVIKRYESPYGSTTCRDKGLCIVDHTVPVRVLAIQLMCVSQAIYGETYFHTHAAQVSPVGVWPQTAIGVDADSHAVITEISHYVHTIASQCKISEVAVECDTLIMMLHCWTAVHGRIRLHDRSQDVWSQYSAELAVREFSDGIASIVITATVVAHAHGTASIASRGQLHMHMPDLI
jgi:hypothetical protein